jgi:membrane protein YqaA with SNARE-associated domain
VKSIIHMIARALFRAGGLGVLTLGIFDSSPLVVPMGNDLLVLALCARYHSRVWYYVLMATAGSVIGCLVTDWVSRKSEGKQEKFLSPNQLRLLRNLVEKHAGWTLFVASMMPPPFPFTAIVAGAAAFRYPRTRLMTVVSLGRLLRFSIEAALAIHYGRWIIRQSQAPWLDHAMIALIVISIAASAFSMYEWSQKAKRTAQSAA